ncbi:hypothetical protein HYG81_13425 [Natrinema zhouii]|uniref:HalOD1 output domain-containing protein n=1 Tax=Natrinema zhouii TaxID=1710539 RepID=UPI001CF79ED3|nr:HalOD1 output domain-containing protein [Natrinema zhouii]QLK27871.2 hypothetical protein HYG81_13425 [Natrinema zhouii]
MSTQYDVTETRQVTTQIVEAVAARKGVDPLNVRPPLYDVVNPEALEALFAPTAAGAERAGRIEFTYADCRITVVAAETVSITVEAITPSEQNRDRSSGRQQLVD